MIKYIELPTVGKILKEEFIDVFGISQKALAEALDVPAGRISEIVNGKRVITADTDLRLTKYFGLSEGYFLRIQANLDLRKTKREINKDIIKIIPFKAIINKKVARTEKHQKTCNEIKNESLFLKQM